MGSRNVWNGSNTLSSIIQDGGGGHLELFELSQLGRWLSDLAEILHDIYESPRRTEAVKVGTGRRNPPPRGVFKNSVLGDISAADQDILTKFGTYVGNGSPLLAEWSKDAFFENPIWMATAVSNKLNCYTLVADCPIRLKFCRMTHTNVPERLFR